MQEPPDDEQLNGDEDEEATGATSGFPGSSATRSKSAIAAPQVRISGRAGKVSIATVIVSYEGLSLASRLRLPAPGHHTGLLFIGRNTAWLRPG